MLTVFKYASKENITSVIEDLSDWWHFFLTESTPFTPLVTLGTTRRGLGGLQPRPVPSSLYQM